jgi:predicted outer membrane repeat protein
MVGNRGEAHNFFNERKIAMYLRRYLRKAAHSLLRPTGRRSRHRAPAPSYRPRLETLETRELLSTFTVVLATDSGGLAGQKVSATTGDLRYCVEQADAAHTATTDTIGFSSVITSTPHTITLNSANGPLVVSDSHPLTINGPSTRTVNVSGGNQIGVFEIFGGTVTIKNLAIIYGNAASSQDSSGGGIYSTNQATLTLSNCIFDHDSATNDGGGIYSSGKTILTNCTFYLDTARYGGGIALNGDLAVTSTMTNSTFSHDTASFGGGGIVNEDTTTLTNCTFSNDSSGNPAFNTISGGGGILNLGTVTLSNCTLANDTASGPTAGGGIANGGTATLTKCTLSNDSAGNAGGGLFNSGTVTLTNCTLSNDSAGNAGGGISNYGTVMLSNCTLSNDSAADVNGNHLGGGGIFNAGTITLTACTLSSDSAKGGSSGIAHGGGIYNAGGTATLTNCTLSNDYSANNDGGGIFDYGPVTLTMTGCTLNNDSAGFAGGAICNSGGMATLTNCTLADNSAVGSLGIGGALFVEGSQTATLTNCTLSGNSAVSEGGGIFVNANNGGGILNLTNTIVAGNTAGSAGPDIFGAVSTADHNLVGDATGSSGISNGVNGNIVGGNGNPVIDARLGPLQNNGGPTETMALLTDSPAIGHADNAAAPAKDQRGFTRIDEAGETTDIGAFEL